MTKAPFMATLLNSTSSLVESRRYEQLLRRTTAVADNCGGSEMSMRILVTIGCVLTKP